MRYEASLISTSKDRWWASVWHSKLTLINHWSANVSRCFTATWERLYLVSTCIPRGPVVWAWKKRKLETDMAAAWKHLHCFWDIAVGKIYEYEPREILTRKIRQGFALKCRENECCMSRCKRMAVVIFLLAGSSHGGSPVGYWVAVPCRGDLHCTVWLLNPKGWEDAEKIFDWCIQGETVMIMQVLRLFLSWALAVSTRRCCWA